MIERVISVPAQPFHDQRPGTSGLRKRTAIFSQPHYLELYLQAVIDALGNLRGKTVVIGGDGRYHNRPAIETAIRMLSAAEVSRVLVGRDGLMSTPALSLMVRAKNAYAGLLFTASHNPGGPQGDFGVKLNLGNGAPAPERVTEAIFQHSRRLTGYRTLDRVAIDLAKPGAQLCFETLVEVVDPVTDYARAMEKLFDFAALEKLIGSRDFRFRFDAMNAVTGPYAREIFENRLRAPVGSVVNAVPLEDFGGLHPDPGPSYAKDLFAAMAEDTGPDFGAASDGDGDRHVVLGRDLAVAPSDSIAILAANHQAAPGYAKRVNGVARSMPTSRALDAVAKHLGVPCYETPTGWKYFTSLLDSGRIVLCGEESAGAGSDHAREKDGLWAVLYWLNILAVRRMSVGALVRTHWRAFGRHAFQRLDYVGLEEDGARAMMQDLRARLRDIEGRRVHGLLIDTADEYSYVDPVDGTTADRQGIRIVTADHARIVYRLSGTGTSGETLRIYVERLVREGDMLDASAGRLVAGLPGAAALLADIPRYTGRSAPDVVS
ncbi:MAG: alpha-D-glucose phosphate-specific phosphoglucomutase [Alphaproteobacteria bacterium]|nr:alpha-D-glucose phosphate-specific phosphoglucomutase [Alphaproteobacteria bacterium]